MADLPSDTVTFLFTDIQGSTTLWENGPDSTHVTLVRNVALVHETVERTEGTLVKLRGKGDRHFAVVGRVTDW